MLCCTFRNDGRKAFKGYLTVTLMFNFRQNGPIISSGSAVKEMGASALEHLERRSKLSTRTLNSLLLKCQRNPEICGEAKTCATKSRVAGSYIDSCK